MYLNCCFDMKLIRLFIETKVVQLKFIDDKESK
jgi:hypothetical protein